MPADELFWYCMLFFNFKAAKKIEEFPKNEK
jgi:hypothetical protein